MVIYWTNSAVQDLHDFMEVTKKSNPKEYLSNLVKSVNLLIPNPELGKPFFYSKGNLVRQFIHKEHKILYFIDDEKLHVIAVIHHKQDTNAKIKFIKKYLKN